MIAMRVTAGTQLYVRGSLDLIKALRTVSGEDTCRSFSGASRVQTCCTACTVCDGHPALQVTRLFAGSKWLTLAETH